MSAFYAVADKYKPNMSKHTLSHKDNSQLAHLLFWFAARFRALTNALLPAAPHIIIPPDHLIRPRSDISWCHVISGIVPL